ncbi:MAG: TetR/AcrR family transcriptional regulator [Chloroflexota bacterium]
MDRRIRRTRKALQDALIDLLHEKSLENIDIQEITELADTARVTFYRHYGTKEELLIDAMHDIHDRFMEHFQIPTLLTAMNPAKPPPSKALFDFLLEDRAFYKRLFQSSISALIQQQLREYAVRQIIEVLRKLPIGTKLPEDMVANHIASAMIGNIVWWLTEDIAYTPLEMAQATRSLIAFGLAGPPLAYRLWSRD